MERRLITPAEAALLLEPTAATAAKCIQAGLLSLLAGDRIELAESGGRFSKPSLLLMPRGSTAELPAHVEALGRSLALNSRGTKLSGPDVIHALQRAFGSNYRRYVHDEVAPSLIKRGLIERRDDKWLGLFARIRYVRTARGVALAAPLERLMLEIEQLPATIKRDPEQAIRVTRSAGVLLIMSPKARRQIPALRKLLANRGEDSSSLAYVAIDSDDDERPGMLLDIGDMALQFDVLSLFDSIDGVGDLTDSDGGSSDGGDGGGGD